ncbi:MAG TPA: hypothetical protein VMA72_20250 [Streptosporangiaceae bacterium]|nr:hypothetical protein [Streptosporangiaceae bacterium]
MRTAIDGVHTADGFRPVTATAAASARQTDTGEAAAGEADNDPARAWADFESFVKTAEPRLSRALAAAYGFEDGRDATA